VLKGLSPDQVLNAVSLVLRERLAPSESLRQLAAPLFLRQRLIAEARLRYETRYAPYEHNFAKIGNQLRSNRYSFCASWQKEADAYGQYQHHPGNYADCEKGLFDSIRRIKWMHLLLPCWNRAGAQPAFSVTDRSQGSGGDVLSMGAGKCVCES